MALRFDELSPREFEELCLALLDAEGFATRHVGATGADGGWDLRAVKDGEVRCVQCKRVRSFGPKKAEAEARKALVHRDEHPFATWTLMAACDLGQGTADALVALAGGRCGIELVGRSDLKARLRRFPRLQDRFFHGDAPRQRLVYLSAVKADRALAADLRRDLEGVLQRHAGESWRVEWHDPAEEVGLPEVSPRAGWGLLVMSPELLANRQRLDLWKNPPGQLAQGARYRRLAVAVRPSVPWPPWLVEKVDRLELRPETYRIDLAKIVAKWIGETEGERVASDAEVAATKVPEPELAGEVYQQLTTWLAPLMETRLARRSLAGALGLDGRKALDDFESAELRASAAIVLCRQDDDPLRAALRLIGVVRDEVEDTESAARLGELDRLAATLSAAATASPVDRGLLPAWLHKVRDDHTRLVSFFQQTHELGLLDRVYVELAMAPEGWRRAEAEALLEGPAGRAGKPLSGAALSIEEVLALDADADGWVTGRWVVRGDPGAGKTTLLRHLAAKLAADEGRRWVPIFQSLPVLVRSKQGLLDHVVERFEDSTELSGLAPVLEQEGQQGRLLLLLDGLDEVSPEDRPKAESRLRGLAQRWPDTPILVSTRPIGYRRFSEDFRQLELQPLDHQRRLEFLACWFGRGDGEHGRGDGNLGRGPGEPEMARAEASLKQLQATGLDELTGNPLYLTLMAMLLEQKVEPHRNRSKLYNQVFTLLLEAKHKHEGFEPIERPDLVREVLRLLAFTLTVDNRDAETRAALEERLYRDELDGLRAKLRKVPRWDGPMSLFLDDLAEKVGILGPHDGEDAEWKFWHRTFKEALTAEHLLTLSETERLEQASSLAGQESRWAEPYALLTGQVDDADALVRQLVETNRDLGLRALATARAVSDNTLDEILELTEDPEARSKVFERMPTLIADPERALKLIDRLRRRTRNGDDLYWLHHAAGLVAELDQGAAEEVRKLRLELFDHLAPPDPERFRTIDTKSDGQVPLWRRIPAGEGWIGSPADEEGRFDWELPRTQIEVVRAFGMSAVPITNAHYAAFDPARADASKPDVPVVGLSWYEAVSFCRWLACCPDFAGARLPTEHEWEYACRAGTTTRYWSGNSESDLARVGWYKENSGGSPHAVGEKAANPWGLYDVHGNVWEWTAGPWTRNPSQEAGITADPAELPADLAGLPRDVRVFRGGCYWFVAQVVRSAYRYGRVPRNRVPDQGFRVLLPFAPSDHRT